ncbi:zinc finger protein 687a-like isoform X1 [Lates japonicus]|uniref:Zinc finger protein 687a-like isoform X1 n=1 Tax=Lates japonicus TaxID=270547 RepID=A0AAD3N2K6_LATJO|nr:zinc finger protein 687a-like isoform X1 [Lates japonicus]
MGDMKTPDFDDLLAAFDIPDIDAKEAIQSSPEEQRNEVGTNADGGGSGSPSCFPCSPASHSDRPVVSVIVKNTVRSESFEEEEKSGSDKTDNPTCGDVAPQVQVKLGDLTSQLGPKLPAEEPQISNGFEGSVPRDPGVCNTEPWSLHSPLKSTLNDNESDSDRGAEVGSIQHTTDVMNSLKPLLFPQSPTSASPNPSTTPPHSVSPHLSPLSPQKEEAGLLGNSSSSPLPQNGNIKAEIKHVIHSDDDDSEPDLGSPLVIQESPDTLMSSPPKFKLRPELLGSPETISHPPHLSFSLASAKPKPPLEDEGQPTTLSSPSGAPQPQSPEDPLPSVSTSSASTQEEKYPEHVIDERDSPESPPPSETGLVVPNRSSSPDLTQTPTVNHKDSPHQKELMESEPSREDRPGDTEELSEKMAEGGENLKEENNGAGTSSEDAVSASATETDSSPLRPLKVKIKMSTGSITRTVTGVAPKRSARATSRAVGSSKPSPEHHNTKSKRELSQQSQAPAAATLQDARAAAPEGASAIKQKSTGVTKTKVSPTAVSITKTATLPSIAISSPRVSPGGINLRSLGQKTLNSGMIHPAPSSLVPQSGSRPASIVNNTGAIISKSQTNLVEAFNKILNNKNLLPSYKPDLTSPLPAEWGIPLPAQGYRCLECGDAFALEQSLARHYDRRSLRIEVTCNHCAKRLAFFNKCSLLLHAREHKERGLIMQCSHLVMKPVPVEQMIGQQEPTAIGVLSPSLLSSSSAPSSSSSGSVTPNPTPQSHQVVPNKKGEEVQYTTNKCPECLTQFSSKEAVAEHFQEIKPAHTTPCTECSPPMLLPNSCSAAAHQRIHQGCLPHVCPECGGTAKQPLFQTHLDKTCLHFARRIGYRCSSCLVVFGGLNSVKSHIQQAHCDMFHKCPSCPMAFKSAPSIQNHITDQHPTLTDGQAMLIYKCVMCDTVFTQKPLLYIHFDTHLTNQKVHVFKCPECTKLFSQRNSLLDHFKTHKTSTSKQELPLPPAASSRSRPSVKLESSDGEEWTDKDKEEKVKTERMKTPSGWKCAPCHARYTDREDYITHMAEQHGKVLKKFPCNKCESSFTTTSSLRRHIRDKHKMMNRGFRCQFCTESKKTFSSRTMLERHIQLRHSINAISQDRLGDGDEADSSSEQDGSLGARRRRRGAVKMEHDEESTDGMSPVKRLRAPSSAPAPYPPPDSGFRCAPCGFTTEDQTSFLEHISQHRRGGTEGGGLQCLQCGACFTSTSSLSRHRFITHKVRDAFTDNQQALSMHPAPSPGNSRNHDDKGSLDCSAPASPSSQSSIAQGKEEEGTLACKVCGKHFEKATDLNTHFRTHGMAFINARNAGKTT